MHDGDIRLTPNQNVIIANVAEGQARGDRGARRASMGCCAPRSGLRRNSMACVALPTCGLALAESERYLPELDRRARGAARRARARRGRHRHPHDRLPERLRAALSRRDRLGRQRPRPLQSLSRRGVRRLAHVKLYAEDLDHDGIVAALDPLFAAYAEERETGRALRRFRHPRGLCRGDRQRPRFPRQCRSRGGGARTCACRACPEICGSRCCPSGAAALSHAFG